jgi:predicted adenylyl cyclase CyaB
MSQNLEIKARVLSLSEVIRVANSLHAQSKGILRQRDIYYSVSHGRLKLRIIQPRSAELIYYKRPNKKGQRYSDYTVLPVFDAKATDAFYTAAFGQKVVVEKKRTLYLYKNARIHLDNVRGLGAFIEFEVLVKHGKRQALSMLKFLLARFKIKQSEMIAASYSDLLLRTRKKSIQKLV